MTTEIKPEKNTLLEGLYMSQGTYCTQCKLCFTPSLWHDHTLCQMSGLVCAFTHECRFPVLQAKRRDSAGSHFPTTART